MEATVYEAVRRVCGCVEEDCGGNCSKQYTPITEYPTEPACSSDEANNNTEECVVDNLSVKDQSILKMSSCGITSPYMNTRAAKGQSYEPTNCEHVANVVSHGVAILPSLIGFSFVMDATHRELQYFLMLIYGIFTTMLFSASTMYHLVEFLYRPTRQHTKLRYYLHIADRAVIYLFIAASYTPWLALRHCGYPGLNLKWMIWVFAIVGILYQYNFHEKYKTIELILYIAVAGLPSVAIFTMNDRSGLELMIAGGLVYIFGVIFFKLDGVVPFAHAIWHIHVLVGAAVHTYAVYSTLLGPDPNNPVPDVSRINDEL